MRADRPATDDEVKLLTEEGFVADNDSGLTWARSAHGVSMTTEDALRFIARKRKRERLRSLVALVAGGRAPAQAEALLRELEGKPVPYSRRPKCGAIPLADTEDRLLCESCNEWYSRIPLRESSVPDFGAEAWQLVRDTSRIACERSEWTVKIELAKAALLRTYQRGQGSRALPPGAIPLTAPQLRANVESDETDDAPIVTTIGELRALVARSGGLCGVRWTDDEDQGVTYTCNRPADHPLDEGHWQDVPHGGRIAVWGEVAPASAPKAPAHDYTDDEIAQAAREADDAMGTIYSQHSDEAGRWVLSRFNVVEEQWAQTFLARIQANRDARGKDPS